MRCRLSWMSMAFRPWEVKEEHPAIVIPRPRTAPSTSRRGAGEEDLPAAFATQRGGRPLQPHAVAVGEAERGEQGDEGIADEHRAPVRTLRELSTAVMTPPRSAALSFS